VKNNRLRDSALIFFIIFIGLFFRRPDAFLNPQIYAEDGPIFLQQFAALGIKSLVIPYAGYLHTIPRLVAFIFGSTVDVLYIPLCYNLSCFLLTFFIALSLWESAKYLNLKHKILFATIFLFIPVGPEMFMNITNSIWITSMYLVNFLFVGYRYYDTGKWKLLKLLVLFIISLTGPFSLLLSPIIILIIFLERKTITTRQLIPMFFILSGGFIQFICIKVLSPKMDRAIPGIPEHFHLLKLIKYNIGDLIFLKNGLIPDMPEKAMAIICIGVFAILLYFLFVNYKKISVSRKYLLVLAPIVYLGSFIAVFWPTETHVLAFGCPRYYFVPYTCFAWIFIIGLDSIIRVKDIVVYFIYFLLQSKNMRYTLADKEWKKQILEYKQRKRHDIDINPDGWKVTLPKRN